MQAALAAEKTAVFKAAAALRWAGAGGNGKNAASALAATAITTVVMEAAEKEAAVKSAG